MDFRRRNSRQRRFGLRDPCPPLLPAAPVGFPEARTRRAIFFPGGINHCSTRHGREVYLGQTRSRERRESACLAPCPEPRRLLTEPTPAVRTWSRERVFMPR